MISIKYLQFFINNVLLQSNCISENDLSTFKNRFFENQDNLFIWIWLAHNIENYLMDKDNFHVKKYITDFNTLEIEDLILELPEKHPLIINKKVIEIANKKLNEINLIDLEELLTSLPWNITQHAEILLAMYGNKVSRTSISISDLLKLSESIKGKFIISNEIYISNTDTSINDYSNIITKSKLLSNPKTLIKEQKGEVFLYFSKYLQDAYFACVLDKYNMAGTLLGIPECCIDSFKNKWTEAIELYNGDLAFMNYINDFKEDSSNDIIQPWQTNAHSMYKGGGLIWHFPCSKECYKTIDLINQRAKLLQEYNYNLYNELYLNQTKPFFLDKSRKISDFKISENDLYIRFY